MKLLIVEMETENRKFWEESEYVGCTRNTVHYQRVNIRWASIQVNNKKKLYI